ncbi:MAG: hypothetical protein QOJ92_1424 [Frankiales bacterium]|nr:hypothetical protein [Frankiales bacterium]
MLTVVRAGPLLTVQDLGRPGLAHLGVSRSGAADRAALVRANRMVGNPDDAACLETTLTSAVLSSDEDVMVALTGAVTERVVGLGRGEAMTVPTAHGGARVYVAVAGGIDVAPVLGSRSRDVLAGLGPAPLKDGDVLPVGAARGDGGPAAPPDPRVDVLALLPGPRVDQVDVSALPCEYVVTRLSNRIAVRLQGPALLHVEASELPSEGLVPGAVQVPPDGQPVIMLADFPITGGYPVIGVVPEAQLSTVAQLRPGERIALALQ